MKILLIILVSFHVNFLISQNIRLHLDKFIETNPNCNNSIVDCSNTVFSSFWCMYHPNGRYILMPDQSIDSIEFYDFDPIGCINYKIDVFRRSGFRLIQPLYIDYLGRIYVHAKEKQKKDPGIYRFNNFNDTTFQLLFLSSDYINDLVFSNNKIYFLVFHKQIYYECDTNFNIIRTIQNPFPINSCISIKNNCDSTVNYCFGRYMPMDTFFKETSRDIDSLFVFTYDFEKGKVIDSLCSIKLWLQKWAVKASSKEAFLASDPECDLLIDLDRNNSSGLLPYDFDLHYQLCDNSASLICDSDVYVHTSVPMDSIRLEIIGALDIPGEELQTGTGFPAGYQLKKRNDTTYILIPGTNNSDDEIANALKSIWFIDWNFPVKSGLRQIRLQGYNAIKKGVWVNSFIRIGHKPNSGKDTSLTICLDPLMVDAISLLINAEQGGTWSPGLKSGNNLFNSNLDLSTTYSYITNDVYCGSDTALLQIKKGNIIPIDLGPDQMICKNDSISINLNDPNISSVIWSDGNQQPNRRLYQPGKYLVEITSTTGCKSSDSITISNSTFLFDKFNEDSVCLGQDYLYKGKNYQAGDLISDTLIAIKGCDTLIQIQLKEKSTPKIETSLSVCEGSFVNYKGVNFTGGEDLVIKISSPSFGCDTVEHIIVSLLKIPDIIFSMDSVICQNETKTIQVNNHLQYNWSTNEHTQNISISSSGKYSVTVTDQNGCTAIAEKEIKDAPALQYANLIQNPKCPGEENGSIRIESLPSNSTIKEFQLDNQKQSIGQFNNLKAGNYKLILTDEYGCKFEEFIQLKDPDPLEVNLPSSLQFEEGEKKQIIFKLESGTIKNILIDPNEGIKKINDSIYLIQSKVNTDYHILITDENECSKEYILQVTVNKSGDLYFPSAFSPNGDGVNDHFYPYSKNPKPISYFAIYDRWGEQIFLAKDIHSNQEAQGWNGKFNDQDVIPGVYIYVIEYVNGDGNLSRKSGDITVIR